MLEDHITKEEALARIRAAWHAEPQMETVSLQEANGRIAAEDHFAKYDLPVVRALGMDGIALNFDLLEDGIPDTSGWKKGLEYERADTGDDFDDRYDTVLPIEWISREGSGIRIEPKGGPGLGGGQGGPRLRRGMNVRPCGSTIRKGDLLLRANTRISPLEIAALATGGHGSAKVIKKPVISFIPTGSELIPAGEVPGRGQNFDANSLMAGAMLQELGAEVLNFGILRDEKGSIGDILDEALAKSDIVLINGGSSKGEEDFNNHIIEERGRQLFHWVRAVPGRPMNASMIDGRLVINLAGPTLGAYYGIDWCVRELLSDWFGIKVRWGADTEVILDTDLHTPPMSMIVRLTVTRGEDGELHAAPGGGPVKGPGRFQAVQPDANAIYITKIGAEPPEKGDRITVRMVR
ncbi:MAG: molybdopterin molybdotransferase MoeA [Anaerovoracaceae bacterium]|jgi:molybdopterin molybdotransferase